MLHPDFRRKQLLPAPSLKFSIKKILPRLQKEKSPKERKSNNKEKVSPLTVWSPNKSIPAADGSIQLSTNAKVDQLHFGVISEQNVLSFDVAMDDFVCVQMTKTSEDFPTDECDPLFFHRHCFAS